MNFDYQTPLISGTLYYYDIEYERQTAQNVFEILEKYYLCSPRKIFANKLTSNKYTDYDELSKQLFINAYCEKDVFEIDVLCSQNENNTDFWRIYWGLTYYKNSRIVGSKTLMPWNTLSIQSTHERLRNPIIYNIFLKTFKELIQYLSPFYATIDDISNRNHLMDKIHAPHFIPDEIQEIYWGNYFGEKHCKNFKMENSTNIPAQNIERIGNGVFFTLTDFALDFASKEAKNNRNKIKKHLKML